MPWVGASRTTDSRPTPLGQSEEAKGGPSPSTPSSRSFGVFLPSKAGGTASSATRHRYNRVAQNLFQYAPRASRCLFAHVRFTMTHTKQYALWGGRQVVVMCCCRGDKHCCPVTNFAACQWCALRCYFYSRESLLQQVQVS